MHGARADQPALATPTCELTGCGFRKLWPHPLRNFWPVLLVATIRSGIVNEDRATRWDDEFRAGK